MKIFMLALTIFLLISPCDASEPNWLIKLRRLKVLKSTRADVEREFKGAKIIEVSDALETGRSVGKYVRYETSDGLLNADYAGGTCSEVRSSFGYDVVSGTLTRLRFKPKKPVMASSLNFEFEKFEAENVFDMPGVALLYHFEKGIQLTISQRRLIGIVFRPPDNSDDLECNEEKAKPRL